MNWFVKPGLAKAENEPSLFWRLCSLLSNAAFFFLKPDQLAAIFALNILLEDCRVPRFLRLYGQCLADVADYSEWRTGRRATGLVFGRPR